MNKTYQDLGLLLLRLYSGGLMAYSHGFPKLAKLFRGDFGFANPIGIGELPSLVLAVFAEFFCALLVVIGFRSRLATIPLMITMFVAAFIQHAGDPFSKKEFGLLYFFAYLVLFLMGPGKYSIDKK